MAKQKTNPADDEILVRTALLEVMDQPESTKIAAISALLSKQTTYLRSDLKKILQELEKQKARSFYFGKERNDESKIQIPPGITIPMNYRITDEGIFESVRKNNIEFELCIIESPLLIERMTINIDNNDCGVVLTFTQNSQWIQQHVPQQVISNKTSITTLSRFGLLINSENAGAVIRYLHAQLAASMSTISVTRITSKPGWGSDGNNRHFVFGKKVFQVSGAPSIEMQAVSYSHQLVASLEEKGSIDDWLAAMSWAKNYPLALFLIGVAMAAPLIELLDVTNFMIHIWGHSTGGKTAVIQIGISLYGLPTREGLLLGWKTTKVGAEYRAAMSNSLPTTFDDNSEAVNEATISEIVYMLGNAQGKTRGAKDGARDLIRFRTIGLSSGEKPCSTSTSLRGQDVRSIEINIPPFGEKSSEMGKKVEWLVGVISNNYGFAASRFFPYLIDIANSSEMLLSLKTRFNQLRDNIRSNTDDPYLSRTVGYYAVIDLGLQLFAELFPELSISQDQIELSIRTVFVEHAKNLKIESNIDYKAYAYIWDKILSEPRRFETEAKSNSGDESYGQGPLPVLWGKIATRKAGCKVLGSGYAILATKLRELLVDGGYSFESCSRFFKDNGWVWTDEKGNLWPVEFEGRTVRMWVFDEEKAIEVGVLAKTNNKTSYAGIEVEYIEPPSPSRFRKYDGGRG